MSSHCSSKHERHEDKRETAKKSPGYHNQEGKALLASPPRLFVEDVTHEKVQATKAEEDGTCIESLEGPNQCFQSVARDRVRAQSIAENPCKRHYS